MVADVSLLDANFQPIEGKNVKRDADGLTIRFSVTDTAQSIPVVYKGILPDLFKDGKGCVAQGHVGDRTATAVEHGRARRISRRAGR